MQEDPGPCPICGYPHSGCKPNPGDSVRVLEHRDAMTPVTPAPDVKPAPVLEPEPEPFTTSTYERAKHGRKRPTGRR